MARENIGMICSFNGTLKIEQNNVPSYEGGVVKLVSVRRTCSYQDLVEKIHRVTKINPREFNISLVCNWPITNQRFTAVQINDDDDVAALMSLTESGQSVEIFVKKDIIEPQSDLEPGPMTYEVLYDQPQHRSDAISHGQSLTIVYVVDHTRKHTEWPVDDFRMIELIDMAGFLHCAQIQWIRLDWPLITALIERWRPETCTFHMRVGEMTITLQDVAIIMGLRVDGDAITGTDDVWYEDLCDRLLGVIPPKMKGGMVKLTWLRDTFSVLPDDATDEQVAYHTRAYLLHMLGSMLFPNYSKDQVHLRWLPLLEDFNACGQLSWGSAVLSYLYREMSKVSLMKTKEFHACSTLLMIWTWEHLSIGRPSLRSIRQLDRTIPLACRWNVHRTFEETPTRQIKFYRNELDVLELTQVIWEPYNTILRQLPQICTAGASIWRSRVPLICFDCVEMYVPDRVFRQFGLVQHIPMAVERVSRQHHRGKGRTNWRSVHAVYIERWDQREQCIEDEHVPALDHREYMQWYWGITRRWILTEITPSVSYMPRGAQERDMTSEFLEIIQLARHGRVSDDLDTVHMLFARIMRHVRSMFRRHRSSIHGGQLTDSDDDEEIHIPVARTRGAQTRSTRTRGAYIEEAGSSQLGPSQLDEVGLS